MFLRTPYNYDANQASDEAGLECTDLSKAIQSQKEEADINTIVKRFGLSGELPQNVRMPMYGDFTDIKDYHTAMNSVIAAKDSFMRLPWDVRREFDNDPEQFVEFCLNPENKEKAAKLGLVNPEDTAKQATGTAPASAGTEPGATPAQPAGNPA